MDQDVTRVNEFNVVKRPTDHFHVGRFAATITRRQAVNLAVWIVYQTGLSTKEIEEALAQICFQQREEK